MTDREKKMLEELLDVEEGLTEFEVKFVDDLDKKMRANPKLILSTKQSEKLRQIWDERV